MNLNYSTSSQNKKSYNPKLGKLPDAVYIPSWLLQIPAVQLSYQAKLLYGRLAQWVNHQGVVYRSAKQLTFELGMSLSSVERTLKELRDVGLIGTYQTCSGGVNHYIFYEHKWMDVILHKNLQYWGTDRENAENELSNELSTEYVNNPVDKSIIPPAEVKPPLPHNWGHPSPTTGGINKEVKKALLKEAPEASFNKDEMLKKEATSIKPAKINLPVLLESMHTLLQIHPAGILKLMGIAKNRSQRLQDIWQAKRHALIDAGVTGGRAFHYVKFLIETGEDFSYRAQLVELGKNPLQEKKLPQNNEFKHFCGQQFTRADGLIVQIHEDGSAKRIENGQSYYVRPADVLPIYQAILSGKLQLSESMLEV